MRILFLSSYIEDYSGAKVLLNLANEISNIGHDVRILSTTSSKTSSEFIKTIKYNPLEIIVNKISNNIFPNNINLASGKLEKEINKFNPDVINIHWTHGEVIPVELITKLSKEYITFWTIHDLWPISNNKFFEFENNKNHLSIYQKFLRLFQSNPEFLYKKKRNQLSSSKINTISPSLWMKEKVEESGIFKSKNLQIYNGINQRVFKKLNKNQLLEKNKLSNKKKILYISADLKNVRKGASDFINITNELSKEIDFEVILVGNNSDNLKKQLNTNIKVTSFGVVRNEEKLNEIYNISDIMVSTTKADNLPSTLLESISSGTPVVSFDVGGIREILQFEDLLVAPDNQDEFIIKLHSLLSDEIKIEIYSDDLLKKAQKEFDLHKQAIKYLATFESLMKPSD